MGETLYRKQIIDVIMKNKQEIIDIINKDIKDNNYETFGKSIENSASMCVSSFLFKNNLIKSYKIAENKNEFPDIFFTLPNDRHLAFDWKSFLMKKEDKISLRPANDLGRIDAIPSHIKKYKKNIILGFIAYSSQNRKCEVIDMDVNVFYKKINVIKNKCSSDRFSYRLKDGQLRPNKFGYENDIKNTKHFSMILKNTTFVWVNNLISDLLDKHPENKKYWKNESEN